MIDGEEEVNKTLILLPQGAEIVAEDERVKHMETVLKSWDVAKGIWMAEMKMKEQVLRINALSHLKTVFSNIL